MEKRKRSRKGTKGWNFIPLQRRLTPEEWRKKRFFEVIRLKKEKMERGGETGKSIPLSLVSRKKAEEV